MQDRFRGKTWIFWAQLIVSGYLGIMAVIVGTYVWSGNVRNYKGETLSELAIPSILFGVCMLVVAALAAFNIVGRFRPIIRCYREGIECNLVGATSLDGVPFLPGLYRVAWAILSLQGFRSQRVRIIWEDFVGAKVAGIPMMYLLILNGTVTNAKTGLVSNSIAFKQVAIKVHPQQVADVLNGFAGNTAQREQLPHWPPDSPSMSSGTAA